MQEIRHATSVLMDPVLSRYFADGNRNLQIPVFHLLKIIWTLEKENATEAMWTSQLGALAELLREWKGGNSP